MGKFLDEFFVFPIKVYDGFSMKKAMREEEEASAEGPVPIDWVVGHVRIPARDLGRTIWHDGFSRERKVEEVADKGFDLTIVINDIYGEFVCTWPRKKFEEKLEAFMESWEENQKQQLQGMMGPMYISGIEPFKDGSIADGKFIPKD